MDPSHLRTRFVDCLWYELQQEPNHFALPFLKEIILKDNVYYEVSDHYQPGGHWYNLLYDGNQEYLSSSGASSIFRRLSLDLAQSRFDELFGRGWDSQEMMEHAPWEDLLRWIPRETPVDAEDVRGLNNIPTYYLPRFRIDGMDEQAYEVRFRLEKRDPYYNAGILPTFGWVTKFSFLGGRILTPEEDTEIDWWEVAEVNQTLPGDEYNTPDEDPLSYHELAPFEGGRKSRGEHAEFQGMSLQGT